MSTRNVFIPIIVCISVNSGGTVLKTGWWPKVREAFEEFEVKSSKFTTKKNLEIDDIMIHSHKLVALRLIGGWKREDVANITHSKVQDIGKWEDPSTKNRIPYDMAMQLVLLANFDVFRRDTNVFITRFFRECSVFEMKSDYLQEKRFLNSILTVLPVYIAFVLITSYLGFLSTFALYILFTYLGGL
ncbi:MAG: hypothetical protein V3U09_01230 [Thermoplasmata archaeon]